MEKLFKKYIAGACNPEEYSKVVDFINQRGNDHGLDDFLKKYWNGISMNTSEVQNPALLDRIHHHIAITENKAAQRKLTIYKISLQIAAVLLVGLVLASVWNYENSKYHTNSAITQNISTPYASRTSFDLPDGSKVWLNAGSTISFPANFDNKSRLVKLEGEAYFDVKKDEIPFLVQTLEFTVNVVGTAFNVMAYKDELALVTLERGKVELQKEGKILGILNPGQQAHFIDESDKIAIETVDPEIFTSWKEGRLIFKAEPLVYVVKRLERWYNLKITIDDQSLNNLKVTGKIELESFSEVLDLLEFTLPIKYQYSKDERTLTINKRK